MTQYTKIEHKHVGMNAIIRCIGDMGPHFEASVEERWESAASLGIVRIQIFAPQLENGKVPILIDHQLIHIDRSKVRVIIR